MSTGTASAVRVIPPACVQAGRAASDPALRMSSSTTCGADCQSSRPHGRGEDIMPITQLAPSRASETNPNHHLWKNGRLWWLAVTLLHDGWRQERVRQSLGTDDVLEARRRRDLVLARLARPAGTAAAPVRARTADAGLLRRVDARLAVLGEGHHLVGG